MVGAGKSLQGKTAIITGAASGIGRATATLFAREGASVLLVDLNEVAGKEVEREICARGLQSIFEAADVTRASDCQRIAQRAMKAFGGIHVLSNNAGIIYRATVLETSEEEWDRLMSVNVKSIFLLSREVLPIMARCGGGVIINTASGWGLTGGSKAAAYCASKGAVVLFTKAMAVDHGPQNIRVNCICPGDTDTPMLRKEAEQLSEDPGEFLAGSARRPMGRIGKPEEIAQAALYLASDASSFVTGTALVVDGGGLAGSL